MDLLEEHQITLLRGNAAEIAALVNDKRNELKSGNSSQVQEVVSKGVDSEGVSNPGQLAEQAAKLFGMTSIVTGPVDGISNGVKTVEVAHGSAMMPLVVGTGCLLGAFWAVLSVLNRAVKVARKTLYFILLYMALRPIRWPVK